MGSIPQVSCPCMGSIPQVSCPCMGSIPQVSSPSNSLLLSLAFGPEDGILFGYNFLLYRVQKAPRGCEPVARGAHRCEPRQLRQQRRTAHCFGSRAARTSHTAGGGGWG
eukprot:gene10634-biopygen9353